MSELYQLPDGWEWKKLDDITLLITKGTTPTTNGHQFLTKGINFLKIENIINGEIDLSSIKMFISEDAHESQKRSQLNVDDVLFSIAGTIGDTAIVKQEHLPMNINQAIAIIRPQKMLDSRFLKHSLLSVISKNTKDKQRGGAIKNISLGDIKDIDYPLPPLIEQKRIVQKLDALFERIDKAIALLQKNIAAADNFMNSVLNDVFSDLEQNYEKELWSNMLTIKNGKHYKDVVDDNGQYPIYGSGGILKYANNYICNENSVIIGRKGTINSPLFVREKFWNIDTAFGIESNTDKLVPVFLFYFTVKFNFLELNQSTTLPSLAKSHLLKIKMVLPPLEIQQKVVAYLDNISAQIEQVKSAQQQKMQNLLDLKSSILDQAFHGKL